MQIMCIYIYMQVLLWFCSPETSLNAKSHVTLQNMLVSFPSLITILMLVLAYLEACNYKCLFSLNACLALFYLFELFINYLFG